MVITITPNGLTVVVGDHFINDSALRKSIGSEILTSAVGLFEPAIREQVLTLARETFK